MRDLEKRIVQNNSPLVSIITPSLNQGRFIEQTIASVLKQTYRNIEYIVMDGGSTDNTIDVIKKYAKDPRMKWFSQKDDGQYDAVNRGFTLASGDVLGWINADDVYTNDTLAKVSAVFQNYPNVEIVYGRLFSFKTERKTLRKLFCRNFSYKWLRRYCYTNPSATFIRKSVIQKDRLLIDISVPTYGDWDWFLRMAEHGKKFHYLPEILANFRIHHGSRIMRMGQEQTRLERSMIARRHSIPMKYMVLWIDNVIPWAERFENLFFLLKQGKWHEMATRLVSSSIFICRDFWRKLV